MGKRTRYEPGTFCWTDLATTDPEGAKAFYGNVFGWEPATGGEWDEGEDGRPILWRRPGYGDFLELSEPGIRQRHDDLGAPEGFVDAVAWLVPLTGGEPAHWSVTFAVDDADAIAETAVRLGGEVLVPPMDAPWVRTTVIRDPQGATFTASRFTPPA